MYKYNASVNNHWRIFLKSAKYVQIIKKNQISGHKTLDVDTSIAITPTFASFYKTLPASAHSPCSQLSLQGEVGFYNI